jgi:hypothetical protein
MRKDDDDADDIDDAHFLDVPPLVFFLSFPFL